jgi:hypothetical protein
VLVTTNWDAVTANDLDLTACFRFIAGDNLNDIFNISWSSGSQHARPQLIDHLEGATQMLFV